MIENIKNVIRPKYHRAKLAIVRRQFYTFIKRRMGPFAVPADLGPIPPKDLFLKTAYLSEDIAAAAFGPGSARESKYRHGAMSTWMEWFSRLEALGVNLRVIGAILDLGCGSGRLIRPLRALSGVRLVGCDVNPDCTRWCAEHLLGIEVHQNELQPPLSFAADGSFDLVYAYSVFTHIPLAWQRAWLEDICRILRPGGFFICTVHGARHLEQQLTSSDRERLVADGHLEFTSDDDRASLSTRIGGSGWDVFLTRSQVIARFGAVFDLRDYVPGKQDVLYLQKRVARPGDTN